VLSALIIQLLVCVLSTLRQPALEAQKDDDNHLIRVGRFARAIRAFICASVTLCVLPADASK